MPLHSLLVGLLQECGCCRYAGWEANWTDAQLVVKASRLGRQARCRKQASGWACPAHLQLAGVRGGSRMSAFDG